MAQLVTSLLFPCPSASYNIDSYPGELIWIPRPPLEPEDSGEGEKAGTPDSGGGAGTGEPGGVCRPASLDAEAGTVPCLLLPYESARFILIFFHSNAEDLGRCRWFCYFLRDQFQVHVLAVEYPGYGICPGPPTKAGVVANAIGALDFVTKTMGLPLEQVKIFGRSIGTGPALALAARAKTAGLILVTPFLNIRRLFQDRLGPLSFWVDEWFENDVEITRVKCPVMIIHGQRDMIIPFAHGEELFTKCRQRKLFVSPTDMEHNTNLTIDVSYLIVPMFRFFALPDYCFRELKVPSWAFDKRRSAAYRRPDPEVSSSLSSVRSATCAGDGAGLSTPVPEGDDADQPVDPTALAAHSGVKGYGRGRGDSSPIRSVQAQAQLTQPTVRHSEKSTTRSYDFQAPICDGTVVEPAEDSDVLGPSPTSQCASRSCALQARCNQGVMVAWPAVCGDRALGCERWSCVPCRKPAYSEMGFSALDSPRVVPQRHDGSLDASGSGVDADVAVVAGMFGSRLRELPTGRGSGKGSGVSSTIPSHDRDWSGERPPPVEPGFDPDSEPDLDGADFPQSSGFGAAAFVGFEAVPPPHARGDTGGLRLPIGPRSADLGSSDARGRNLPNASSTVELDSRSESTLAL